MKALVTGVKGQLGYDVVNELVKLSKIDCKHIAYELKLMKLANSNK